MMESAMQFAVILSLLFISLIVGNAEVHDARDEEGERVKYWQAATEKIYEKCNQNEANCKRDIGNLIKMTLDKENTLGELTKEKKMCLKKNSIYQNKRNSCYEEKDVYHNENVDIEGQLESVKTKPVVSSVSYCHDITGAPDQNFLSEIHDGLMLGQMYPYWESSSNYSLSWLMDTINFNNSVWQIDSEGNGIIQHAGICQCGINVEQDVEIVESLPSQQCYGLESVIMGEKMFCNRKDRKTVFVYDLQARELDFAMAFPEAGDYTYDYWPNGFFDIEVDERGIWVMYGSSDSDGNITITSVDPATGSHLNTWVTDVKKSSVGNAFMVDGIMYTVNASDENPTHISYVYNTVASQGKFLSETEIVFDKGGHHLTQMLKYNPRFKTLMSTSTTASMYQYRLHFEKCE